MKNIMITVIVFISVCAALHAQNTVSYGYDAAGNRISRVIYVPGLKSASVEEEEQPASVYSEMLADIELKIYPNPTDGLLNVEIHNLPDGKTADIRVYNLSGQMLVSRGKVAGFTDIDLSGQPQGTYLMKITAGEYQTEWKIIKK